MGRPVILDCDTGTDDAVALALAVDHPGLDLLGVTTVWGNHELGHTTDNTLRVLAHLGRADIPVHQGLPGPFAGRSPTLPPGRADLPPTLDLPAAARGATSGDAVGWLVETLAAPAGPVALVATGPWSNLAAALAVDPDLLDRLDRLVLLGGAHRRAGVTPWAERNVWCDPRAADAVLRAAAAARTPTVLVTMDATYAAPLTRADADRFDALGTAAGALAATMVRERVAAYRHHPELAAAGAAPVHDPLAVAFLVEPAVVTTGPASVTVDTAPGERLGRTLIRLDEGDASSVHVALDADAAAYRSVLAAAFGARRDR